ncbi:TonB-dependent receptor domain-containing protein [Billgrantia desiderata]|uniref:TonB-dependent receptor domain-containing protein n=1 Tax=Billgrantia desiderata TaxID=52021 RepID=UPI00089EE54E|nr:TonB-dependent receptor [Halomonas desiderata]SEG22604.1 outer membrane receptor for ferrienterochelin and colicins [Halomonas desiderata]
MLHARRTALAVAVASAPLAFTAQAQDSARLDNVVVTAAGFEQSLRDAPASISVVTREELERRQFANIAEAIADIPGVDVRSGVGKTGGLNVSIRGMPSNYTLILIDGRRQNAAADVTPNGFGETATSFMPPLSAIERIEVIRGPMSTLYGSDAMGGVINIITRRVANEWSGSVSAESTFQQHREEPNSQALSVFASGPLVEETLGLQLRGRVYNRGASERLMEGTGRDPRPAEGEIYSIGGRLNLTPDDTNEFWLDAERARQWYDNTDSRLGSLDGSNPNNPDQVYGYDDHMRFNRDQIALGHTGRFAAGTWESSVTHAITETVGRTIPHPNAGPGTPHPALPHAPIISSPRTLENEQTVLDTKLTTNLGAHMLTFGGQYMEAELTDDLAPDSYDESQWALFIEDEWWLRDDLALTLGGRYENHDAFSGHFTPRGYLVWNADDSWTLKGGVSRGYKTPTLNQLRDGINNVTAQGARLLIGNPDLQPEKSTNYEIGAHYDNLAGFSAGATFFHTDFTDRIVTASERAVTGHPTIPDGTYDQAINIGEAQTQGVELEARYRFAPAWEVRGGYTYTDTEIKSDEARGASLTLAPRHKLTAAVSWEINERWSTTLEGEHYSGRKRFASAPEAGTQDAALAAAVGDKFKSYELFNLSSTYRVADNVRLTGTIYNLLDTDFGTGTTYEYEGETFAAYEYFTSGQSINGAYMPRRSFWLSATYEF